MAKHIQDHHKGFLGGPSISSVDILTQQIFVQPKILIEVQSADEGLPPDPEPLNQFLQAALRRYEEMEVGRQVANQNLPVDVDAANLTPWLEASCQLLPKAKGY